MTAHITSPSYAKSAKFYSAELFEKVIRGMTENALKGKSNGGTILFGYTVDSEQSD